MKLSAKSHALLDILLHVGFDSLKSLINPMSLLHDYGGWSSHRSMHRSLETLKNQGYIIWDDSRETGSWVLKLSKLGRDAILDEIDPEKAWNEHWDGKWRTMSFDLPQHASKLRQQLRGWLKRHRFGRLQGSLWISHRSHDHWIKGIQKLTSDPTAVVLQEATPLGHTSNKDYISKSWNFKAINNKYRSYLAFVTSTRRSKSSQTTLHQWALQESQLWKEAFESDPFLPNSLIPKGYLGKEAWETRSEILHEQIQRLAHPAS